MLEKETNLPIINLPPQTILSIGPSLDSEAIVLKKEVVALIVDSSKYPDYWIVRLFDEKNQNFSLNRYYLVVPSSS